MLMYRQTDNLDLVSYSDADFAGCIYSRKSHLGTFSSWHVKLFLGEVSNKL